MTIAPSPTAEATRLTEPLRTSPPANTPGLLVSKIIGWRAGRRRSPVAGGVHRRGAGRHEALLVELDRAPQPRGVGYRTDEDEQGPRFLVVHRSCCSRPRRIAVRR